MSETPLDSEQTETKRRSSRNIKAWMIVSQLIAGLILIPWCGLVLFAGMIGWPDVIEYEGGWNFIDITFSMMLFYPLFAIIPVIISWILYGRRQYRWAATVTSFPVVMFVLGIFLWILAGSIGQ